MTPENNDQQRIRKELARALEAREEGNEGRARVCARRAAGFAVETYLRQQEIDPPTQSAYGLLELMGSNPALPKTIQNSLYLLTLRVNEDHDLPQQADLIQESRNLIHFLFPEFS